MTDAVDLEMFMEKLRTLVNENDNDTLFRDNPLIEAKKPEIQLLYEELGHLIGCCFKDQEQLHDHVGNLKERVVEAARQAEDIIDMFISSAIIWNDDSLRLSYAERVSSSIFKDEEQRHDLEEVGNLMKRLIEEARQAEEDDSRRSSYEEWMPFSIYIYEEQLLHDLEEVGNLMKRLIEAVRQATDLVDMFISSTVIKNGDRMRLSYEERVSSSIFKDEGKLNDLGDVGNLKKRLIEAAHQEEDIADMFISSARLSYEERFLSFIFKQQEQPHDVGILKIKLVKSARSFADILNMFMSCRLGVSHAEIYHGVIELKKRLIEAAHQAEDISDMFIFVSVIKKDDSLRLSYQKRAASSNIESRLLCHDSEIFTLTPGPVVTHYLLDCSLKNLKDVMDDLKSIGDEIISNNKGNLFQKHFNLQDMMVDMKIHEATGTTGSSGNTTVNLSATEREELIVGFEDDALLILDRLTRHQKKLDRISIVGMGGQGKTTLATKIFNNSLVKYRFDKRGWATVSQAYSKKGLLLQLLTSIGKSVEKTASESKLCEMLYKSLKGMRYLIVIDDIWSCKAWDDVGICFPDDKTGSRVLITTRLTEVALHISQGGFTHSLPHLNEDQSWELLCKKTFRGHECPESLIETGKYIAKKCGGLPLALVVIAGLLEKGERSKDLWDKIAKSVGSYIINDPVGCLDTLALSYDHLPCHLKNCFLYTGGFPEDYLIEVRRLIRLWIAEGFIKEAGLRSLEEEGEYYLMDLIDRNLLIVADKSSNGGVKSCRLHDLLREVCFKKAFEENFFKRVNFSNSKIILGSDSVSSIAKQQRLFTDYKVLWDKFPLYFASHTRSFLCFYDSRPPNKNERLTSLTPSFMLLRVLDLQNVPRVDFGHISLLIHLRYLAVWSFDNVLTFSKAKLWSLQTLIIKGIFQRFMYSADNMVKLRHLRCYRIDIPTDFNVPALFNLQTVSRLVLDHRTQFLLESFPHIKKLGCSISSESSIDHGLLSFAMLKQLEALKIDTDMSESLTFANPIRFPSTLRKLTLEGLCLPWSHMSTIQQLPKLEVLKLLYSSFSGHLWETGDEQFHQLKYLELSGLNIRIWDASSSSFPRLRKLAVRKCRDLSEIPLELGDILTLEQIEIDDLNSAVLDSVNRIQEAQHEDGNYDIHVTVN